MANTTDKKNLRRRDFTLPGVLLLLCLAVPGLQSAQADASNRQAAIAEALDKAGGSSKVIGVREETNKDGRVIFAVKVLSEGRVRVYRIPKSSS